MERFGSIFLLFLDGSFMVGANDSFGRWDEEDFKSFEAALAVRVDSRI